MQDITTTTINLAYLDSYRDVPVNQLDLFVLKGNGLHFKDGDDPAENDIVRMSLLMGICAAKDPESEIVLERALKRWPNPRVDLTDNEGSSALLYAIKSGSYAKVEMLINHGAKVNGIIAHNDVPCPVSYAYQTRNLRILELLLDRGASLAIPNLFEEEVTYHESTRTEDIAIIKMILDRWYPVEFLGYHIEGIAIEDVANDILPLFISRMPFMRGVVLKGNVYRQEQVLLFRTHLSFAHTRFDDDSFRDFGHLYSEMRSEFLILVLCSSKSRRHVNCPISELPIEMFRVASEFLIQAGYLNEQEDEED